MPSITPNKLAERLSHGQPIAAIVLLGTDSYLRAMCRTKIIEAFVPEAARDWAVARVSPRESSWDEILQRAETMPMLAPRQVIVIQDAESVEKLGDKSRDEILRVLEKYFASPAPFTLLLFEAGALDGRQKFTKLLQEKALVVELTIGNESAAELAVHMAQELGADLDRPAANMLAEILNSEPARMRIELEKLATYVHGSEPGSGQDGKQTRGRITTAEVEGLVVAARKNTVWQLAEMLGSRKRASALAFLDNLLREGEQPAGIVGALAWSYRKLIEARDLPPHTSGYEAARQLQMNPVAAEAAVRQAHRVPKTDLLTGLVALAEADSELKSSNPDPRAFMEFLVARLTNSATVPVSRSA